MNRLQKSQLQHSEVREEMGAILDKEEKTPEDHEMLSTLSKRSQTLELETRSAIIAEGDCKEIITPTLDGEAKELEGLITRSNVGGIFDAVISQGHTSGAVKELQEQNSG